MKKRKSKKHAPSSPCITGTICINAKRGFGFVQPDTPYLQQYPTDIFIPPGFLKGAMDGDHVKIIVSPQGSDKFRGSIEAVLSRGKEYLIGTIIEILSPEFAMVRIQKNAQHNPLYKVKLIKGKYAIGDRILIQTPKWTVKKQPKSTLQMVRSLGNITNAESDLPAIIAEYGLREQFPEDVIREAQAFTQQQITREIKKRSDLRSLLCFTIDSASAKDFDDAVSLERKDDHSWELGVHIADVSHYVKPHSALDKEARMRCNSVYFTNTVIPMLPHELSDGLCSLKPRVNRLAVSVFMNFSKDGTFLDYRIERSVIQSKYRMTYDQVDLILTRELDHPLSPVLQDMWRLSQLFIADKDSRGCVRFTLPATSMQLDEHSEPIGINSHTQTDAHRLIEEFMIKANETVARHMSKHNITIPFRIHEEPNHPSLESFVQLAHNLGFHLDPHEDKTCFQTFLHHTIVGHPLEHILNAHFVRSMKMAVYSTENKGHYGLQLDYYTHFTSPIRRYADLIVHRALFQTPSNQELHELEEITQLCSSQERVAAKAEFAYDHLKKLRYLQKFLYKQPDATYAAVLISTSPEGWSVCIPGFSLETVIPTEQIPNVYRIDGQAPRKKLRTQPPTPGLPLMLKLHKADLITQETLWTIVPPKPQQKTVNAKRRSHKHAHPRKARNKHTKTKTKK